MSADMPDGRSTATTGMPGPVDVRNHRLEHALERRPQARPEQRVDDQIARRDLGEVQLPGLPVADLHHSEPEAAENLQVRARVAADLRDHTQDEHRDVDAAVDERAGDHESVTTVVAPSAQDGDMPLRKVLEAGLHGGDHLPAGILHEHNRRNPDLFYRAAIGLAHLAAVENPHSARV